MLPLCSNPECCHRRWWTPYKVSLEELKLIRSRRLVPKNHTDVFYWRNFHWSVHSYCHHWIRSWTLFLVYFPPYWRTDLLPAGKAEKPLIGWEIWRKTRRGIVNATAQKFSLVQIFQDGGQPQVVSAQIREMIWILRRIQVTLDRVITRSVNRSVINSTDCQRIHFGGHPLEQIAFEAASKHVHPRSSSS